MIDFKQRFAEYNAATGEFAFSNVRNGLIVGLVRWRCFWIPASHTHY